MTGTVDLGGATLDALLLGAFAPSLGDSFTIIDNDGDDAVIGTFAGRSEGARPRGLLCRFQLLSSRRATNLSIFCATPASASASRTSFRARWNLTPSGSVTAAAMVSASSAAAASSA